MRQNEQRPFAAIALESSHEVGTVRIERKGLGRDPLRFKHLPQVFDRLRLVAGRAAGIDSKQRLEAIENFGFLFFKIDAGDLGDYLKAEEQREQRDLHAKSWHHASMLLSHGWQVIKSYLPSSGTSRARQYYVPVERC